MARTGCFMWIGAIGRHVPLGRSLRDGCIYREGNTGMGGLTRGLEGLIASAMWRAYLPRDTCYTDKNMAAPL